MIELRNITDAENALATYMPAVKKITGKDITLQRMKPLMEAIGNPESELRVIHIAGTSGKTSTAYYIAELLRKTGKSVGLTVSPYVDSVTERIQLNGRPISDAEFCKHLEEFLELIATVNPRPTYFELVVAFAFWVFRKNGVDYAVIETGMGGLHDATNVAQNSDKVCVITDIGIDHTKFLGSTKPLIAVQKIGIVHTSNVVFMYGQSSDVMAVVKDQCRSVKAKLNLLDQILEKNNSTVTVDSLPLYQRRNWLLAKRVYEYICERDGLDTLSKDALNASQLLSVPGRMDTLTIGDKTLIMDGAHNAQKMRAFVGSVLAQYPGKKAAILVSLKEDKDYDGVIKELLPVASSFVLTTFKISQDLPAVAIDPEVLATTTRQLGFDDISVVPDHKNAYLELLAKPEPLLIVTGSFYLLGQMRESIIKPNK